MKTLPEIEELTALTLGSLDNLQAVEANPYLYTKIHQRMLLNKQQTRMATTKMMLRLSAALLMLLCINVAGIYLLHKSRHNSKPVTGINAFSQTYFPSNNAYNY